MNGARVADGFGIVEVIVAALVLVVGLLGSFTVLVVTIQSSLLTRAREGGSALAREVTEDARSIPFAQL